MPKIEVVEQDAVFFRCRACRTVLGVCCPAVLLIGAALIRGVVTLACQSCGRERTWRPAPVDGKGVSGDN